MAFSFIICIWHEGNYRNERKDYLGRSTFYLRQEAYKAQSFVTGEDKSLREMIALPFSPSHQLGEFQ
jgi:hypothetical protein